MTAKVELVFRGKEINPRILSSGQTMYGYGPFKKSEEFIPVVVMALDEGKGIDVYKRDTHHNLDESDNDNYKVGDPMYTLTRTAGAKTTIFHLYPT